MKLLFSLSAAFLLGMPVSANAVCIDKHGHAYPPAYIADETGTVYGRTPTGQPLRVTGLQPYREVCDSLLFRSASRLCPGGEAVVDASRDPRFCKKSRMGVHDCVHITCGRS